MKKRTAIVCCIVVFIVIAGFPFAYVYNVNTFNQTKSKLESLGYNVTSSGVDLSSYIMSGGTHTILDYSTFLLWLQQENIQKTIYMQGLTFYVFYVDMPYLIALQYTPSHAIWWIFG
jgi:hypothetical protein